MPSRFWTVAAAALVSMGFAASGSAEEARAGGGTPVAITHGRQVRAADTGPEAAGYRPVRHFAGGVLKDGASPPFVRRIDVATVYDGRQVPAPHLLIEDVVIDGSLDIYAALPVVMRGVRVEVATDSPWAVHTRPGAGPFHFLWSEASGAQAGTGGGAPRVGVGLLLRADHAVVLRSRIRRVADAVHTDGADQSVTESLLDELSSRSGDHNDAIQIAPQATAIVIARNRIRNPNPQTSCVYIEGNDVTVEANDLAGGAWVVYGGANSNGHGGPGSTAIKVRDNVFGLDLFPKSGHFGPVAYWNKTAGAGNVWSDNTFADGRPVVP